MIGLSKIDDLCQQPMNYYHIQGGEIHMHYIVACEELQSSRQMYQDMHFGVEGEGLMMDVVVL